MLKFLNKILKKEFTFERKGYLLVVTCEEKGKSIVNYVYNKENKSFEKKKIFAVNHISPTSYFPGVCEAIEEINGKREFKKFLASNNVMGIYYVETRVKEREENLFVSETTSSEFFYVPSKLTLNIKNR